jgi:hypothetical protein
VVALLVISLHKIGDLSLQRKRCLVYSIFWT